MNRIILCVAILLLHLVTVQAQIRTRTGNDSPLRKLQIAEVAVSNLYVDSVDEDKLVEDAIRGMLEKLDPHSTYSTPKEVKDMNEPLQGNFEGIGVQFNMVEDTLLVIQTVSGGPSEKMGILAGDRIVTVNDSSMLALRCHARRLYVACVVLRVLRYYLVSFAPASVTVFHLLSHATRFL